ncbi:MAG: hypothetical protein KGJ21_06720 [Pseudomonadota bacterium]|nr:hypothetical protein [Pseudomonadota bacterium]
MDIQKAKYNKFSVISLPALIAFSVIAELAAIPFLFSVRKRTKYGIRQEKHLSDFELIVLSDVLDKHPMWLLFGDKVPGKYKP